jgi:hypothetical protein
VDSIGSGQSPVAISRSRRPCSADLFCMLLTNIKDQLSFIVDEFCLTLRTDGLLGLPSYLIVKRNLKVMLTDTN